MDKKTLCIIRSDSIEKAAKLNQVLYDHFAEVFDDVLFLDMNKVFTTRLRYGRLSHEKERGTLPGKFKVRSVKNISEFRDILRSGNMVVISAFSEEWFDWYIHYYLRKYSIPLVYVFLIPSMVNFQYRKMPFSRIINRFRIRYLSTMIFVHFLKTGFVSKIDTVFLSQKADNAKGLETRYKEVVVTNSRFYDNFLKDNHKISNDYIVFLDSMPPYHGDQIRFGHKPPDRKLYYQNLNRVFAAIESITGKEVVICLHFRYNEDNLKEDFGQRKAFKYRTDEFIAKADMVLFHETSAVVSAVLYKKKIIQLRGSKFNEFINANCDCYPKLFSFSALDMYECSADSIRKTLEELKIDQESYDNFLKKYIIASEQKDMLSCVQIADHISRKYGVLKNEKEKILR